MASSIIVKTLDDIIPIFTSHGVGQKQVLLANEECASAITQIAVTTLKENEKVGAHLHPSMDEHYIFLSGKGQMLVDSEVVECKAGCFVLVPANIEHSMECFKEMKFITIGVAL